MASQNEVWEYILQRDWNLKGGVSWKRFWVVFEVGGGARQKEIESIFHLGRIGRNLFQCALPQSESLIVH